MIIDNLKPVRENIDENQMLEREWLHTPHMIIDNLKPVGENIAEDQVLERERLHTRQVTIDSLRPVRDSIEHLFVKEIESIWIDEAKLRNDITANKAREQQSIEARGHVKNEESAIDDNIQEDQVDDQLAEERDDVAVHVNEGAKIQAKDVEMNAEQEPISEKGKQHDDSGMQDDDCIVVPDLHESSPTSEPKTAEAAVDGEAQEDHGESVRASSAAQAYVTDDEEQQPAVAEIEKAKRKQYGVGVGVAVNKTRAENQFTMYNPGDIREETPPRAAEVAAPVVVTPPLSGMLNEYKMPVSQHSVKASNRDTTAYVRRPKQPKLLDKQKLKAKLWNPKVEKNSDSQQVVTLQHSLKSFKSLELIPLAKKKPRPPVLPENLRASSQSPTPMQQMKHSMDKMQKKSKKPRVPKVAELLPGAKLIVPTKISQEVESPRRADRKQQSPPSAQTRLNYKTINVRTNLSLTNIHNQSVDNQRNHSQTTLKSPNCGSLYISDQKQQAHQKQLQYLQQKQRQKKLKKRRSKMQSPHSSGVEDKLSVVRVVKPSQLRSTQQKYNTPHASHFQISAPDFESEGKSYATLPVAQQRMINSPHESNYVADRRTKMPPLQHYNSKQPYEQHLVSQLLSAYGPSKNLLPQTEFRSNRGYAELKFTTSTKSLKADVQDRNMIPNTSSISYLGKRSSIIRANKQQMTQQPKAMLLKHEDSFSNSPFQLANTHARKIKDKLEKMPVLELGNQIMSQNVSPQDPEPAVETAATDTFSRSLMPLMIESRYTTSQAKTTSIARAMITENQPVIQVKPNFISAVENRKKSMEVLTRSSKAAIYQILAQNSQAFTIQEKTHIDGFRKAQSKQKKTLHGMIIKSTSKEQLAPLRSVTHRTQQAIKTSVSQVSNLPAVQMGNNSYAQIEEYGAGSDFHRTGAKDSGSSITRNAYNNKMRMTNKTELAKHSEMQNSLSRGRHSKLNLVGASTTAYPTFAAKDMSEIIYKEASEAGIPALNSGSGTRKRQPIDHRHNNFLPSFDSRGNVGVVTDSKEFVNDERAYPEQRQRSFLRNLNAPMTLQERQSSISEIEGMTESDNGQKSPFRATLPSLEQKSKNNLLGIPAPGSITSSDGYGDDKF